MNIAITADSTCDLSKEIIDRYNITIIPLYINKGSESFRDSLEITPNDIFEYVESGAGICQTAALNVSDYIEYFEKLLQNHDAVIHLNISSGFSSCYANACIAADELENVYVIDTQNLSTGSGNLVLDAAIMAEAGKSPVEIVDTITDEIPKVESSFVIDTLKYLHKGGRCSALTALGANLLKLKPCIEVIDGKMDVGKKYRGNFKTVILQYVRDRLKERTDVDPRRIFITYAIGTPADVVDAVEEEVKSCMHFDEIIRTEAGCTVSNHCGPVCLGILFFKK